VFSTRFTRHKIWIYSLLDLTGAFCKNTFLLPLYKPVKEQGTSSGPGGRRRRCSGDLGTRVSCGIGRRGRGAPKDVLTTGGDRREASDFEKGQPAVVSMHKRCSGASRRRAGAANVQLGVAVFLAFLVGSGEQPKRRTEAAAARQWPAAAQGQGEARGG
jgi:hypothetical protein